MTKSSAIRLKMTKVEAFDDRNNDNFQQKRILYHNFGQKNHIISPGTLHVEGPLYLIWWRNRVTDKRFLSNQDINEILIKETQQFH